MKKHVAELTHPNIASLVHPLSVGRKEGKGKRIKVSFHFHPSFSFTVERSTNVA
ncbi:MAG TPA: hypothetical protein VNW95_03205 [Mucilaginibacter sp.]|nr:hypothetical protein [Mucilaginibacter sp.]